MSDILERLNRYNPPDRTNDDQRQISVDIHEAAVEIERLRENTSLLRAALVTITSDNNAGTMRTTARAALEVTR